MTTARFTCRRAAICSAAVGVLLVWLLGCSRKQDGDKDLPAANSNTVLNIGEKVTVHSKILSEDRTCWVSLPRSYNSKNKRFLLQKYPVLYVLDGDAHFQWASGMVQYMSDNFQIPELIIVAILNTDRMRDLTPTKFKVPAGFTNTNDMKQVNEALALFATTGGGESFQKFLKEELFPYIESKYRTSPLRVLAGHSLGGLIALDDFLHRPPIFNAWIAVDPSLSWDERMLSKKAKLMFETTNDFHGLVYISLSSTGDGEASNFAGLLAPHDSPTFHSTMQRFPAEDHETTPLVSIYNGLLFVFEGYRFQLSDDRAPARVREHFEKISQRLGVQILPPELFVNDLGYDFVKNQQLDKAIGCFLLNVTNYPDSWNAYDSLAEGYMTKGESELAVKNYQRSLDLNPENKGAREWLKKLNRR